MILSPAIQVIDLKNYDNLYCEYSERGMHTYVNNPIDLFKDEAYPLVVRIADED